MTIQFSTYAESLALSQSGLEHEGTITPLGRGIPTTLSELVRYVEQMPTADEAEVFIEIDRAALGDLDGDPTAFLPYLYPVTARVSGGDLVVTVTTADRAMSPV